MDKEELRRYSRQLIIKEIGEEGQEKIRKGKVLIIGCGALGSLGAMQLAGAGVGKIAIADYDTIDISNLHRQLFYSSEESGRRKAEILSERMKGLNPNVDVKVLNTFIKKDNALVFFPEYDIIVDATDSACAKRMISQCCEKAGKVCCIGGISDFRGQVTTVYPGDTKPEEYFEDEEDSMMPCEIAGVISPAAGICASIQSSEVMKHLIGRGVSLRNKILFFNLLNNSFIVLDK